MFNQRQISFLQSLGLAQAASESERLAFFNGLDAATRAQIKAVGGASPAPAPAGAANPPTLLEPAAAPAATAPAAPAAGGEPVVPAAAMPAAPAPASPAPAPAAAAPATPAEPAPAPVADVAGSVNAERQRVSGILDVASAMSMDQAWAQRAIQAGMTIVEASQAAAALQRERADAAPVADVSGGEDLNLDSLGTAMSDAIVLRAGGRLSEENSDAAGRFQSFRMGADGQPVARQAHGRAHQFAHMSLAEMAQAYLQAAGVPTVGMTRASICQAVFNRRRMLSLLQAAGAGGLVHSSSDFDAILEDTVTKRLQAAYIELSPTWQQWARENSTIQDFDPVTVAQLGSIGTPPKVSEGAEYGYATVGDSKEFYVLSKYGEVIGITWEAMLRDDMSAFARLPMLQAAACLRIEDDLAYAQLTSNPNMSDGNALFSNEHSNLAAAPAALSVESLGAGRASMRKQTGTRGEHLNLSPSILLVPAAQETIADQLIASMVDPAKSNSTTNPFNGRLTVVTNPRLDAASATAWYLLASTQAIDTVEMGFLAGHRQPMTESRDGFTIDAREYKVKHVCAAKAIDWRGMYRNAGA